ncbi:MAG: hypothetical protein MOP51_2888 [Citricoccus sp.]|jgi:hypothetical protein|nr:hypothetical protein [Citricoccus sp. WCRC_4]
MTERKRYRPRPERTVVAVRLRLDMPGFRYRKWGAEQYCKAGDWLVDDDGDIRTVDADVFAATYRRVGHGQYRKTTPVWVERAEEEGSVETKEGWTHFGPGDYVVSNNADGTDAYAMNPETLESLYEPDDED